MAHPIQPVVLAIDIGTSSVKAGLYDGQARAVEDAQATVAHEQDVGSDGKAEEPIDRVVEAVEQAVDEICAIAEGIKVEIAAVGMDSMSSTVLAIDSDGRALTPVFPYADTRSAQDVEQLKSEIDADELHQRTGAMLHTSYVPGRILWLNRTDPRTAGRVDRWLDVSTFLYMRWFASDDIPVSYSIASWSGMLDRHRLWWDEQLMERTGITAKNLPRLTSYENSTSGLSGDFARRWPALASVPFFPAVGDGAAVNVGTGCVGPDRVALSVGTTSAMRVLLDGSAPRVPRGLWAYRLGEHSTLLGGAFSEGGLLLEWATNVLKIPDLAELGHELEGRDPGTHGLTVLPFLAGERATGWATDATGVLQGLRTSTTALDIVQALMEAVSLRFAMVSDLLLPERSEDTVFVASGGAIRNQPWWLQVMADALHAKVVVNNEEQGTSRGAAMLALYAMGEIDSLRSHLPEVRHTYAPRSEASRTLSNAGERQQNLYSRIHPGA